MLWLKRNGLEPYRDLGQERRNRKKHERDVQLLILGTSAGAILALVGNLILTALSSG